MMRAARSWAMPDIRPNITPLIGVLFVLMAVFMAATPPATTSVTFYQPQIDFPSDFHFQKTLLVSIKGADEIYIDGKRTNITSLEPRVDAAASPQHIQYVMVLGDANVPYDTFFHVVDRLKSRGYHVDIITEDME